MQLNNLVLIITIVINLGLGLYIFSKNRKNETNRSFSYILYSVAFWSFSFLMFSIDKSSEWALFWRRVTPCGSALIAGYFLYFSLIFPRKETNTSPVSLFWKVLILAPGYAFVILSLFTPWMIKSFDVVPVFGFIYPAYALYLAAFFAGSLGLLFVKFFREEGRERLQVFYVLIGMGTSVLSGIVVSLLLPLLGQYSLFNLGPSLSLIMVGFVSYAITKHRLMDIDNFLFKALVFVFVITEFIVLFYAIVSNSLNMAILFSILLIQITLGVSVLIQNFKNEINLSFAGFCLSLSFWTFSVFMLKGATTLANVLFWGRVIYIAPILIIYFFLYFTFSFPQKTSFKTGNYKYFLFIPTLICLAMVQGTWILKDALLLPSGPVPLFGIGYPFFAAYFLIYFFYGIYNLVKKLRRSRGAEKNQILYLFIGLFLTIVLASITNLILPAFGEVRFIFLGPVFTLFVVGFTTYAILKHRLMSVELVVQRGFVYTLSSILIIALYALGVYFSEQYLRTTVGYSSAITTPFLVFIIAALFHPLLRSIQGLTDRFFLRDRYSYQRTLRNLSRDIATKIKLEEIAGLIVSTFVSFMQIGEISFLVFSKAKGKYVSVELDSFPTQGHYKYIELEVQSELVKNLKKTKRILIVEEHEEKLARLESESDDDVSELKKIKVEIDIFGFRLWIPILLGEELFGIIALGGKFSGDVYSNEDLRLLNTLANQTALALDNVRLYQEVLEMKNYNEEVLNSLVYGVLTTDDEGIVRTSNPAMCKLIEKELRDIIGKPFTDIFQEKNPLFISINSTLQDKCFYNFEAGLLNKRKGLIPTMINTTLLGTPNKKTGVLLTVRDLTEIKDLENKARQADKLQALGTMSAGMAHEIKNPLSSLRILSQLLPIKYEDPDFRKKLIEIVPNEVSRIDRIVESLLRFARTTKMKFATVDIKDYLEEILKDYLRQAEENHIKIVKNYNTLPEVTLDKDQLIQVFSNLFVNAIQAMPEGGTLTINTKVGKEIEGLIQGVLVEISDTGHGISEENLKHLFDPFFTTKYGGTGLGLTIAHNIVEAHRGEIKVTSKLGQGTAFHIYLPVQQ